MKNKNQWFRFYAEFAHNPKVQVVTEALQRRYVMVLCLHCDGMYENTPDDEIALSLRITADEWVSTKNEFIKRGLLDSDGLISNWEKRQYISDTKDPTAAERQKRHRDKKRNTSRNASVTSRLPETETETYSTETDKKDIVQHSLHDITPDEITSWWNDVASKHGLSKIQLLSKPRLSKLKNRIKSIGGAVNFMLEVEKAIEASSFLRGGSKEGWKCDFDFILQEKSFTKMIEGSYSGGVKSEYSAMAAGRKLIEEGF